MAAAGISSGRMRDKREQKNFYLIIRFIFTFDSLFTLKSIYTAFKNKFRKELTH